MRCIHKCLLLLLTFALFEERERLAVSFELHVAPMQGYTNRHLRYLHRLLLPQATLWTEMLKPDELFEASAMRVENLLSRGYEYDQDSPCVLQLGGDQPEKLCAVAKLAASYGYTRVDLNCGCPSIETNANFGASLMRRPKDVLRIVESIAATLNGAIPLSVKCRIGVHENIAGSNAEIDENLYDKLDEFVSVITETGAVQDLVVHARTAILQGLSPSKNRVVPPLRHDIVLRLAKSHPELRIVANGGISSHKQLEEIRTSGNSLAGAMFGRWALARPFDLLNLHGSSSDTDDKLNRRIDVVTRYCEYAVSESLRGHRDEYSKILMPIIILLYSLEMELLDYESEQNIPGDPALVYQSAMHTLKETNKVMAVLDTGSLRLRSTDFDLYEDVDVSLLKRFRKSIEGVCGKKAMSKLKSNCAENYHK